MGSKVDLGGRQCSILAQRFPNWCHTWCLNDILKIRWLKLSFQNKFFKNGVAPLIADPTPSVKWPQLLNHWRDFDALRDLESSWSLWHSLFYNWKSYLQPFGRGGVVKLWEEKADRLTDSLNDEAAKHIIWIWHYRVLKTAHFERSTVLSPVCVTKVSLKPCYY